MTNLIGGLQNVDSRQGGGETLMEMIIVNLRAGQVRFQFFNTFSQAGNLRSRRKESYVREVTSRSLLEWEASSASMTKQKFFGRVWNMSKELTDEVDAVHFSSTVHLSQGISANFS